MIGKIRKPWSVITLTIFTLGIYSLYWTYQSFKSMKAFRGKGIGGWWGLSSLILTGFLDAFLLPREIGLYFSEQNDPPPVSGETGFWIFLQIPLVGWLIWLYRVQSAMNEIWNSYSPEKTSDNIWAS